MAMQVCSPWTNPCRLCCQGVTETHQCDNSVTEDTYSWNDYDYILAASNILFEKTCYLFPGVCENKVWPCSRCSCRHHPCACGLYSAVELPTDYDVLSIVEVKIGNTVIDPSAYRVERRNWLVRLDGQVWPVANSFGLPDTNVEEFTVSYEHGRIPPIQLKMAAAELACHLKKACDGDKCDLPANVTHIARRGVEIDLVDLQEMMKSGSTGLPMVDFAVSMYAPCPNMKMFDPAKGPRGWQVS